jgi:CheY-like chemotaxis protein
VARLLRQNDFHVEVASGGREGLRRCEALGPRLAAVVLDLTMPDMNGLEVLRRLREQQPWLPVLLVSGYSERMDELPLDERTRFLEKPLMTESLASTLHDMVSLGRGTLSY